MSENNSGFASWMDWRTGLKFGAISSLPFAAVASLPFYMHWGSHYGVAVFPIALVSIPMGLTTTLTGSLWTKLMTMKMEKNKNNSKDNNGDNRSGIVGKEDNWVVRYDMEQKGRREGTLIGVVSSGVVGCFHMAIWRPNTSLSNDYIFGPMRRFALIAFGLQSVWAVAGCTYLGGKLANIKHQQQLQQQQLQ